MNNPKKKEIKIILFTITSKIIKFSVIQLTKQKTSPLKTAEEICENQRVERHPMLCDGSLTVTMTPPPTATHRFHAIAIKISMALFL